jgi:hypothetical protein
MPQPVKLKYNKEFTQEEAQSMVKQAATRQTKAQYQQASLAVTPPPTFSTTPSDNDASASTRTDKHRQEKVTEASDWLPGISWRKNWFS